MSCCQVFDMSKGKRHAIGCPVVKAMLVPKPLRERLSEAFQRSRGVTLSRADVKELVMVEMNQAKKISAEERLQRVCYLVANQFQFREWSVYQTSDEANGPEHSVTTREFLKIVLETVDFVDRERSKAS